MPIPIKNIYYLLCYAWDEFAPEHLARLAAEDASDTLHLFGRLLAAGVRALHRRRLETGYTSHQDDIAYVRGRICIMPTIRQRPKKPNRVVCSFDEISQDVLTNQILKATIVALLNVGTLSATVRVELRNATRLLACVSDVGLGPRMFHQVRLHENNRMYAFLLNVCRFFQESLQPQQDAGQYRFTDVSRQPERMRRIFEKFVRNFLTRRLGHGISVSRDRMQWLASPVDSSDFNLLPQMETDVTLRFQDRTVIIECKYTEALYDNRFLTNKFRPAHLYQLGTYLRNLEHKPHPDDKAEGILLYPTVGAALDQCYILHGHRVRIATLNLDQPWSAIENCLVRIVVAE